MSEMSEAYTYMVRCADGTLYTGWTNNLKKRLTAHNAGTGAKYTRYRRPVEYVYIEICESRHAAMSREGKIKRLDRSQKTALIQCESNSIDQITDL